MPPPARGRSRQLRQAAPAVAEAAVFDGWTETAVASAAAAEGVDPAVAAYAFKGGKSFVCMSSTYERNGERRSRLVLNLPPGKIVTAPQSDMLWVLTEFGVVNLTKRNI